MATAPAYAATVNVGSALVGTVDTSLTAPVGTTIFTAGASGAKIEEITVVATATTVAGLVNVFRHDGTTYHLIDQFTVTAVTVSATAASYRATKKYDNLELKATETIRCAQSIAGNNTILKVTCWGADF